MKPTPNFSKTIERFSGFSGIYNQYRLSPPKELMTSILQCTNSERVRCTVDLGCGTGHSTRPWAKFSDRVIGIDPSADMIKEAVKQTKNPNVIYRNGYGHETGMPHNSVDIVTASSSIHWMEPIPTIEEIVRILKPGGIFSFYGYQCPPVSHSWGLDKAYFRFRKDLDDLEAANIGEGTLNRWGWNEIIDKINHSEKFRFVRTYYLHKKIDWTSEQYQGWIYAHGGLQYLVKKGIGVSINGLDAFKDLIVTSFRGTSKTIFFTYRVITCFI